MAAGETLAVSAASYASDGTFTITCADATNISTQFTAVSRTANTCNYSAVAKATAAAGSASFTVPIHLIRRRHPQRRHHHNHHSYQLHRARRFESGRRLKRRHHSLQLGIAHRLHHLLRRCEKHTRQTHLGNTPRCCYQALRIQNYRQSCGNSGRCHFHDPLHLNIGSDPGRAGNRKSLQHRLYSTEQPHHGGRRDPGNISRQLCF